MAAPLGPAQIGHRREAVQQVQVFPELSGLRGGELARPKKMGDNERAGTVFRRGDPRLDTS